MLKKINPKGLTPLKLVNALMLLAPALALADTAYRCGDAYGPSAQCANGPATPIKPIAELRTTGPVPDPANTAAHDLREAQALEKQRLHAEQQAAQQTLSASIQATPIRLNTAKTGSTPLTTSNAENTAKPAARKGQRARKAQSPYFTAVDPTARPKKKSTAKAAPDKSTSQP